MKSFLILKFFLFGLCLNVWAQADLYKVVYKKGDVKFRRVSQDGESIQRPIVKGDFLIKSDQLLTGDKSLVILGFGDSFKSRIKIGAKSDVTLEGKKSDPEDDKKKTFFFLNLGNVLIKFINKGQSKNKLKVKTKSATIAVRGTNFFVHSYSDGQTLTAVQEGVVFAKHNEKENGLLLTREEGAVFSLKGSSSKLILPRWYKDINWEIEDYTKKIDFFNHKKGLSKVFLTRIQSPIVKVTGENYKDLELEGYAKDLKDNCMKDQAKSCTDLGLYLLANRSRNSNVKGVVQKLFNLACDLKDSNACVWIGRIEYELGEKEKGKSYLINLCEKDDSYACYSLWEIEKAYGESSKAEEYRKRMVKIINELDDLDSTITQFEKSCEVDKAVACFNMGILMEQLGRIKKSQKYYEKGCDMGYGGSCSNLGKLFQEKNKFDEAKKNYTKACYLDEPYGCYNLACLYSLEEKFELSKKYLEMSVRSGYRDWSHIEKDKDLNLLRKTSGFNEFYKGIKEENLSNSSGK